MNRNHIFNKALNPTHHEVNRKVAIHEAGHATAIHLGNKQKELPPVFFQIFITPVNGDFQTVFSCSLTSASRCLFSVMLLLLPLKLGWRQRLCFLPTSKTLLSRFGILCYKRTHNLAFTGSTLIVLLLF